MATTALELEELRKATLGFDALFNNDVAGAKAILASSKSPYHQTGLGLTAFLCAALGLEDNDLFAALSILVQAETAALAQRSQSTSNDGVFGDALQYKLLVGDAVLCQALVHVLTESYLEFLKAIFKLNRAYKSFSQVHKIIYPAGVTENDSMKTIITNLNRHYHVKVKESKETDSTGNGMLSSLLGWGKKRSADPSTLRGSSSSAALPSLAHLSLDVSASSAHPRHSESMPNTRPPSRSNSKSPLQTGEDELPAFAWENDKLSTLIISGASFGSGLFGLIFSLLPPKLRKAIGWLGFSNSNRSVALKMLTLAAMNGSDVHGYFASLALLTYYGLILLMSGFQSDELYLISECEKILDHICAKFPNGTLWILNRAKISRMKRDTISAIGIIEAALEKGTTFRQADSLLVFELSWCYLSEGLLVKAADSFLRMRELSTWSHSTYVFIAAGALINLPLSERTPEVISRITKLFDCLPSLFNQKRIMGDPPTTELFIARKLAYYKAKHARWVVEGRVEAGTEFWHVIRVSPSSELGHFWNTNGRASPSSLSQQIAHLESFTPIPLILAVARTDSRPSILNRAQSNSVSSTRSSLRRQQQQCEYDPTADLDSSEEVAVRDLLLGAAYRAAGDCARARVLLQRLVDLQDAELAEEMWVRSFAVFELAIVECDEAVAEVKMLLLLQKGDGDGATVDDGLKKEGGAEMVQVWKRKLDEALRLLESVLMPGAEYDLRSRLESRAQMLRDEVLLKRKALGL